MLAGHRNPRRVLRSQHGLVPREPGVQPLRSGMAASHVPKFRHRRQNSCSPTKDGGAASPRFDHLRRMHHLREPDFRQRSVSERRVHSFCDIDQSILMPGVRVGRHARVRRAIIDRDVFIPRAALIGYNVDEDRRSTPSPTRTSWSSPKTTSRSSVRSPTRPFGTRRNSIAGALKQEIDA